MSSQWPTTWSQRLYQRSRTYLVSALRRITQYLDTDVNIGYFHNVQKEDRTQSESKKRNWRPWVKKATIAFTVLQVGYCMLPNEMQNQVDNFKQATYNSIREVIQSIAIRQTEHRYVSLEPSVKGQLLQDSTVYYFPPQEATFPSSSATITSDFSGSATTSIYHS